MLIKARFDSVMRNLISRSLKKNYGQSPQRFGDLLLEQREHQIYVQVKNKQRKERERQRKMEEAMELKRRRGRKNAGSGMNTPPPTSPAPEKKKASVHKTLEVVPDVTFKDLNYIAPEKLIAWLFARRPTPTYPVSQILVALYV